MRESDLVVVGGLTVDHFTDGSVAPGGAVLHIARALVGAGYLSQAEGRERYRLGALADVSPLDIAVGWGPMSDSAVLASLDIWQSGRFYFWHYDEEPPVPPPVIVSHSANWHLVPANDVVWRKLRGLRVGDVVQLDGMLVNLENPEVGTMTTSLRRDDTGAGACEIIYVEKALVRPH